jgi:hypothetical protein
VDEVDEARERRTGWLAYSALLVDVALLVAADVVLARGFAARGTDDAFDSSTWLSLGGAYLVLSLAFYVVGARALSWAAATRVDRRYGLTIDDSVTLIGDPQRRNPVVTRVCALPLLLLGPALIVGLAVSELPFPKRGSGPPLSFAVVIVGLVAAIGPLLWAYYGFPGWGLTATGLWLAYAGLLVAGWPVAAVVVGLPVAVAQFIVNARMGRRLLGLR